MSGIVLINELVLVDKIGLNVLYFGQDFSTVFLQYVHKEILQGSVISLTLFNVMLNDYWGCFD